MTEPSFGDAAHWFTVAAIAAIALVATAVGVGIGWWAFKS